MEVKTFEMQVDEGELGVGGQGYSTFYFEDTTPEGGVEDKSLSFY
jgi:hypothetical protein